MDLDLGRVVIVGNLSQIEMNFKDEINYLGDRQYFCVEVLLYQRMRRRKVLK